MPIATRIQQGMRALFAFTQTVDYNLAERYLTQQQMALFHKMAKPEQLHSVNVLRDVLAQDDNTPRDLAVAALMHDSGKARCHLAVWQKTISVIVSKLLPALDDKLSYDGELSFWRAPFVVRRHHPKWSGQLLSEMGSSECAVWLVTHHADAPEKWQNHRYYPLLVRLQKADDAN